MKLKYPVFLILVISIGCASAVGTHQIENSRNKISLSTVESLRMGTTTADEITHLLGKPDKILRMKDGDNLWAYYEGVGDQRAQRLGLVLNEHATTVLTATLVLNDEDHLSQRKAAISHFSYAKFKTKRIPHQTKDYYSEDLICEDPVRGISMSINEADDTVAFLSFSQAIPRKLAGTH